MYIVWQMPIRHLHIIAGSFSKEHGVLGLLNQGVTAPAVARSSNAYHTDSIKVQMSTTIFHHASLAQNWLICLKSPEAPCFQWISLGNCRQTWAPKNGEVRTSVLRGSLKKSALLVNKGLKFSGRESIRRTHPTCQVLISTDPFNHVWKFPTQLKLDPTFQV